MLGCWSNGLKYIFWWYPPFTLFKSGVNHIKLHEIISNFESFWTTCIQVIHLHSYAKQSDISIIKVCTKRKVFMGWDLSEFFLYQDSIQNWPLWIMAYLFFFYDGLSLSSESTHAWFSGDWAISSETFKMGFKHQNWLRIISTPIKKCSLIVPFYH